MYPEVRVFISDRPRALRPPVTRIPRLPTLWRRESYALETMFRPFWRRFLRSGDEIPTLWRRGASLWVRRMGEGSESVLLRSDTDRQAVRACRAAPFSWPDSTGGRPTSSPTPLSLVGVDGGGPSLFQSGQRLRTDSELAWRRG